MTILVGMIGSDGIVLAADQCRIGFPLHEGELNDPMLGRKITHLEKYKVAYAVAGDDWTDGVGYGIAESLEAGELKVGPTLEVSLQNMVRRKLDELATEAEGHKFKDDGIERSLLIAFYSKVPELQLWKVRVQGHPSAKIVDGIAIGGAMANTARFFGHYFQPNMPIKALLPLASHIVLTGNLIDSQMVKGLDIAVFDATGFHFFTEEQKQPLRERSNKLNALIRQRLFAKSS